MKRARTYEEVKPLIGFCKAGKLFDVQAWIAAGNPVNPPVPPEKGRRPHSPLQYAIDAGFHSLVQVLLDGGAEIEDTSKFSALNHALYTRQYEIAKLLVERGADATSVDMDAVFHTWEPDLMVYFIERGAEVEKNNALAQALCSRIRTALKVFRQYKDRFPTFQEQANIALRYHCKEGNLKWVSLMLWAGADPYSKGPDGPEDDPDPEADHTALEMAALYGRFDVFALKQIRLDPNQERAHELVHMATYGGKADLLQRLLAMGYPANDQPNGGSSHIESLARSMGWSWRIGERKKDLDTDESREKMKMLHILVRYGARWIPNDQRDMNSIRRSLLALIPDYTVELIWLMAKYGACERSVIDRLLNSSALRAHVAGHWHRIDVLIQRLPSLGSRTSQAKEPEYPTSVGAP